VVRAAQIRLLSKLAATTKRKLAANRPGKTSKGCESLGNDGIYGSQPAYPCDPLFPCNGLCYNLRAVERAAKEGAASVFPDARRVQPGPSASVSLESPGREGSQATETVNLQQDSAPHEDASRYCPVCSQRLTSRRCKLICTVCGYYMSCADYY
jgi:hypothetical protein